MADILVGKAVCKGFPTRTKLTSCSIDWGIGRSSANSFLIASSTDVDSFLRGEGMSSVPWRAPLRASGKRSFICCITWSKKG